MRERSTKGGAQCFVDDGEKMVYRIEEDGTSIQFVLFGTIELAVELSPETFARFHQLVGEAHTEMSKIARRSGDAEPPLIE
ncbi:MAG: hypothetical protein M3548_18300 [Actinomycetota bacterium]|nr:hypothetical protein [Actinomycetota bacterium]